MPSSIFWAITAASSGSYAVTVIALTLGFFVGIPCGAGGAWMIFKSFTIFGPKVEFADNCTIPAEPYIEKTYLIIPTWII